jgi:hypothetical protein
VLADVTAYMACTRSRKRYLLATHLSDCCYSLLEVYAKFRQSSITGSCNDIPRATIVDKQQKECDGDVFVATTNLSAEVRQHEAYTFNRHSNANITHDRKVWPVELRGDGFF